ncbi:MAG TPA: cellulose binding domain-containing protein [Actinocrinis sp.]|nr:cellulose binding domain-containing protein [Actinocrinis sp.]
MGAGDVTSSWSTSQPGGANAYDVAYDVWYNQTPTTNGPYTQSGEHVSVTNAAYNGAISPGGTTVVGFTGTYTGSADNPPATITCTAR